MVKINWQEISVKTENDAVEAVSEILMNCGATGVSIEDPYMIRRHIAEQNWDDFEFPDELLCRDFVRVVAYLPYDLGFSDKISEFQKRLDLFNTEIFPGAIKEINFFNVQEEDWANSWKAYYKPVKAGERVVIKPTWETYSPGSGDIIIELDPGMAFGTGTHPTTVMCIKALEKLIKGGETVFDIGTGSGILAIAAAKLGAGLVKAVDIDGVAVEAARVNTALNKVGSVVEVISGNLLDRVVGLADLVIANIVADVIKLVSPDVANALKPGGRFLASGIIFPKAEAVIEEVRKSGFMIESVAREGDWVSLVAVRRE